MGKARCMQSFHAEQKGEISLAVGDLVLVTDQGSDGWWEGSCGKRKGIFPGAFVQLMPEWELEEVRPPPAALRFAYDGAEFHEHAQLHGLAASYEGLFRLVPDRLVNDRPVWQHHLRPKHMIAFNGSGWMAQLESQLGTAMGVMLLRDGGCASPDLSDKSWKVTPGWKVEKGKGHPHGMGELLLLDGSAHVGMFVHGAAHGDGVYYDCKGSVHSGAWDGNKRVGRFEL
eukprot:jgi/Chrpa1/8445/Chrysochromulina_OHIO_Genome00017452-RA